MTVTDRAPCPDPLCFGDMLDDPVICENCGRQGRDACIGYVDAYICDLCPDGACARPCGNTDPCRPCMWCAEPQQIGPWLPPKHDKEWQ